MSWRTDVENCPKDGTPFLVIDPYWDDKEISRYSFRMVSWGYLHLDLDDDDPKQEWGFVYDSDLDAGFAYDVENFKYWMKIPKRIDNGQEIIYNHISE